MYVAFVVDGFSRRIVGSKTSGTMTTSLVLDALNMAAWVSGVSTSRADSVNAMPPGQYTLAFGRALRDAGVVQSCALPGCAA